MYMNYEYVCSYTVVQRCWPEESFPKKFWGRQKLPSCPKAAPKLHELSMEGEVVLGQGH